MSWKDEMLSEEELAEQFRSEKNRKRREYYAKTKYSLKRYYKMKAENPNYNREVYAHKLATKPNYNKIRGRKNLDNEQNKWWNWVLKYIKENILVPDEEVIDKLHNQWNLTKRVPRPALPLSVLTPTYKPRFYTKELSEKEIAEFKQSIREKAPNLNVEYEYYTTTMSYDGEIVKIDDTSTPGKILVTVKRKKDEN